MKSVKVKICLGTACMVFGASEFQDLEDILPEEYKDLVDIQGCPCLDACKNNEIGKAPYVEVAGELISSATIPLILSKIEQKLKEENK